MTEIYKLARPKLTGVPCAIMSGHVQDDIKNNMVREILGGLPSFRGEIVVGDPVAPDCLKRTMAFIDDPMSIQLFVYWVYDMRTSGNFPLKERLDIAEAMMNSCGPNVQFADHKLITSAKELAAYKVTLERLKFSGLVLREPYGTFGTQDEEMSFTTM